MKYLLLILILLLPLFSQEIIIANEIGTDTLTTREVKKIYLGRQHLWEDGISIKLATYNDGVLADTFMKLYLGKKHSQFLIYWKQLMFTGRGMMPKILKTEDGMIKYISETKGAIGYISEDKVNLLPPNIKIIKIITD